MLVKVETYFDGECWCAKGIGEDFFTHGKTLDELMENIREAAALHLEEKLNAGESLTILVLSETEVKSVPKATSS